MDWRRDSQASQRRRDLGHPGRYHSPVAINHSILLLTIRARSYAEVEWRYNVKKSKVQCANNLRPWAAVSPSSLPAKAASSECDMLMNPAVSAPFSLAMLKQATPARHAMTPDRGYLSGDAFF